MNILIGNGFNHYVMKIAREADIEDDIIKELDNVINLWRSFDELVSTLEEKLRPKFREYFLYSSLDGEDILFLIYEILDFINLLSSSQKSEEVQSCLSSLRNIIGEEIYAKIYDAVNKFLRQELSGFYRDLLSSFKEKGLLDNASLLEELPINIFTTNYEGIIDILLSPNGFWLGDGFGYCPYFEDRLLLCFNPDFSDSHNLYHIHGSYKFFEGRDQVYKLRTSSFEKKKEGSKQIESNLESLMSFIKNKHLKPLLVYSSFKEKLKLIRKNPVLSYYYNFYIHSISKNKKLALFGISLSNDKHLVEPIINLAFRKKISDTLEIYIFDIATNLTDSNTYKNLYEWLSNIVSEISGKFKKEISMELKAEDKTEAIISLIFKEKKDGTMKKYNSLEIYIKLENTHQFSDLNKLYERFYELSKQNT